MIAKKKKKKIWQIRHILNFIGTFSIISKDKNNNKIVKKKIIIRVAVLIEG
jgi:hypothetical protein